MMKTKGDLTAGNVLGRLVSFALPFLFSSFMQVFYSAVDMWTVGRFSTTIGLPIAAQDTLINISFIAINKK